MDKKICSILFLIMLSGCGEIFPIGSTAKPPNNIPAIQGLESQELENYKSFFCDITLQKTQNDICSTIDIPIRFEELGFTIKTGGTNGRCLVGKDSLGNVLYKRVQIDPIFWSIASQGQKENLVFHEFGHCFLRRPHKLDKISGIPVSIMYPETMESSVYYPNRINFINELYQSSIITNPNAKSIASFYNSIDHEVYEEVHLSAFENNQSKCKEFTRRLF